MKKIMITLGVLSAVLLAVPLVYAACQCGVCKCLGCGC